MSALILSSLVICFTEPPLLWDPVNRIVRSNVGPNQLVYLLNNQSSLDIRPLIVQLNHHHPVILGNVRNQWNNINADLWYSPRTLNSFVVALCEELVPCHRLILDQLRRHIFNPREKVLMQLVGSGGEGAGGVELQQRLLRDIFLKFWQINLLNVVVRLGIDKQFYTYNPFDESFLINLTDRRSNLRGEERDYFSTLEGEIYPEKAKDMRGRPFRMSLFESLPYLVNLRKWEENAKDQEWIGYDGGMLSAIAGHFNATLELVIPVNNDPGYEIYSNSTTILLKPGATKDIVERRADMVINTRPFTPSFLIEYLYPHYFNPVSIILPKAKRISWTSALVSVFHLNVLLLIILTTFFVFLLNLLWHNKQADGAPVALEILAYFLLNSTVSMQRYSDAHRMLLTTWSIFSIVIMSVITGSMYSHIIVARYDADVDSVDQLLETTYQIPIIRQRYSLFEIYKKEEGGLRNGTRNQSIGLSDQYWRLMPKFVVYETLKEIFELIEGNEPFAFMQTNGHCEYFVARERTADRDMSPMYHLMKEIVVPDNAVQIVQFGSPYLPELNTLMLWFKEAGLDLYSRMRLNLKLTVQNAVPEVLGLSYDHVSHAFTLLGVGLSVSLLAFIVEIIWWENVCG